MSNKFLDLLKHQMQVSAATNSKTTTKISSAIQRKDFVGVGVAIKDEIVSNVKDINNEMNKAKTEFFTEWSPQNSKGNTEKAWTPTAKQERIVVKKDNELER